MNRDFFHKKLLFDGRILLKQILWNTIIDSLEKIRLSVLLLSALLCKPFSSESV